MNIGEQLDQNDDLQIAENGRNDGDDHRGDRGGEKEIDKEKDRERDLDKKEPRKSHMVSFLNRFQICVVEVLKWARSFLDGWSASLRRTQKRRRIHMTRAAWTRCVCSTKRFQDSQDTLRLKTDEMRS